MSRCAGRPVASLLVSAILALPAADVAASVTIKVVDAAGAPLQHAVVTATGRDMEPKTSGATRVIAQVGQQFRPRVTVVHRGTRIRFPNTDITQHHVYSFSEARRFELELYSGDDLDPVSFDRNGIVAIGCNIHDWMLGFIVITEDAYAGVTDAQGLVSFSADAGNIDRLTAWHPAGVDSAPVSVDLNAAVSAADGTIEIRLETLPVDPLEFEIDPLQSLFTSNEP